MQSQEGQPARSPFNLRIFQFAVSQFTVRIAILSAEAGLSDSLDIKTVRHSDKEESLRPQKPLKLSENSVASTVSAVAIASSSRALKTASSKQQAALEVPGADRFRAAHCHTWIQCARSSLLLASLVRVNLMIVSEVFCA